MKLDRDDIVLVAGVRTAFRAFGGALKDLSANDLGVVAAKAAIDRSGFAPEDVDHVIFGNALQTSGDAIYCARHIALKAGLPVETPAVTVNRLCGPDSNPSSRPAARSCWARARSCSPAAPRA